MKDPTKPEIKGLKRPMSTFKAPGDHQDKNKIETQAKLSRPITSTHGMPKAGNSAFFASPSIATVQTRTLDPDEMLKHQTNVIFSPTD